MEPPDAGQEPEQKSLESRPPQLSDLLNLCRELNQRHAKYIVVGGFAMIAAGLPRTTGDIDLVVATDPVNEARVYGALATLPDNAVCELGIGELDRYPVIRVADEIVVDLMRSAGGITYDEASLHTVIRNIQGIDVPFASPRLLWKMKRVTHREKDVADLAFLRLWFSANNELPPSD